MKNTGRMPTTPAKIPQAAIDTIEAVWIEALSAPATLPRVASVVEAWTMVMVTACTGITNQPIAKLITSSAQGAGDRPIRTTQAPVPAIPPTRIEGGLMRAARVVISPPARIIDSVWAASIGPAQAGLPPSSFTRNGRYRTLIAPMPSIVTLTPPRAAMSGPERPITRSPSTTARPMPRSRMRIAACASGRPSSRVTPKTSATETRNVAASIRNTGQATPAMPATRPATVAPTTVATIRVACPSEFAASRAPAGTTLGTSAVRAGEKNVPTTACAKASAKMGGSTPAIANGTSTATSRARIASEITMMRRRSARSAQAPANSPIVTGGTATRIEIRAIIAVEPVSERTRKNSAR